MNDQKESKDSRREFFRTVLRSLTLGGMAGAAAFLLTRGRGRGELLCINDQNCRTCSKCGNCPLSEYESPGCGPDCECK